ncbi:MAG: SAM-dependent methyltransferase [Mycobacteriales bacterium]
MIGYDGGPLPSAAQQRLDGAALVVGGRRHLQEVRLPEGVPTVVLRDDPVGALQAAAAEPGDVVVLASGDPGFFGVVRAVRRAVQARAVEARAVEALAVEVAPVEARAVEARAVEALPVEVAPVEVLPALSSVAVAFGRAGVEWDDAVVVSAHGRDPREALAVARSQPKVAVLTDRSCGPAQVGAALAGRTDRVLVVGERLGLPGERVVRLTPEQAAAMAWEDPNIVLVLPAEDLGPGSRVTVAGHRGPQGWALPVEAFAHRNSMISKPEVRALALARLGPRLGDVVWDVGAGSGAVGIECARFGADVHAVEPQAEDAQRVRDNAAAHGVHVHVVHGAAPQALDRLPDPDAVLVGGGGPAVVAACAARRPARLVVLLATLELVAPSVAALEAYDVDTVLLQTCRLTPLAVGSRLAPANPVFVLSGVRRSGSHDVHLDVQTARSPLESPLGPEVHVLAPTTPRQEAPSREPRQEAPSREARQEAPRQEAPRQGTP